MSKQDSCLALAGIFLLAYPILPLAFPVQEHKELVEAADSASKEAQREGGELKTRKDTQRKEAEAASKEKPLCESENKSYERTNTRLDLLTPINHTGSAEKYAAAKDAAALSRDLASHELVRCARDAAKAKRVCERELKALAKAETAYNDPRIKDTDGVLSRRTSRAAENLTSCFSANDIPVPKGFVETTRDRWTRGASEEVVK